MSAVSPLAALVSRHAAPRHVVSIGLRPARHAPMVEIDQTAIVATGLAGDRRTRPGPRAITPIQAEHLPVIAALSAAAAVCCADLQRNIAVPEIDLAAFARASTTRSRFSSKPKASRLKASFCA